MSAEIVEKKSRFIATVTHVESDEEAAALLDKLRAEHRMARHNVYAYVLRAGERMRYSDDGEPQKTAGLPTLDVILHADLTDTMVVTTRYFGGILLGTGGLVRAYTAAAQAGIEAAHIVSVSRCVELSVDIPYAYYEQVLRIAQAAQAQVQQTDFAASVAMVLRMREGAEEELMAKLLELSHGSAAFSLSEAFDSIL